MKYILLNFGIKIMNFFYLFLKMLPVKNKITFISRQGDNISLDFRLLEEEILIKLPDYKVVVLTKKLENDGHINFFEKIIYIFHMLKQMYHVATSKVVILDSYSIVISVLKHKKQLKVIQIWHSIGTMKKFGYEILDKKEGSYAELAKVMQMHKNYNYVLASSEEYKIELAKQFGCDPNIVEIIPLPRVDALLNQQNALKVKKQILLKYNNLNEKKNILYCPTFRKDEEKLKRSLNNVINNINFEKYNLIIKLHPLSKTKIIDNRVITADEFTTMDMLFVSDYIISDYSCIIYEAALLKKPINLYIFDFDEYSEGRGFWLDLKKDIPGCVSKDINMILKNIENNHYDLEEIEKFSKKYINITEDSSCKRIVNLIKSII